MLLSSVLSADINLLHRFLQVEQIAPVQPAGDLLRAVTAAFASWPYENLTKIIRAAETGNPVEARRSPSLVLEEHWQLGTGGTCFSLTATLLSLVRSLGYVADPILADRRYGPGTHSALLVLLTGQPHLLDPGYLMVYPVPLPTSDPITLSTSFNQIILTPRAEGRLVDLHTLQQGQRTYRLTYRINPTEPGEFLRAWDTSFDWDMMHYPVLSRVVAGQQLYLQQNRYQLREPGRVFRTEIPPEQLVGRIVDSFGIAPQVAWRALEILQRKGDLHGGSSPS